MLDNSLLGRNKGSIKHAQRSTSTSKVVKPYHSCFHLPSEIGDEVLSTCIPQHLLGALTGQHSYANTEGFALMNNLTPKLCLTAQNMA